MDLGPEPKTPSPKPLARNPKPQTPNPKPHTLNQLACRYMKVTNSKNSKSQARHARRKQMAYYCSYYYLLLLLWLLLLLNKETSTSSTKKSPAQGKHNENRCLIITVLNDKRKTKRQDTGATGAAEHSKSSLLQNVFSYYRMCSLTTECVLLRQDTGATEHSKSSLLYPKLNPTLYPKLKPTI